MCLWVVVHSDGVFIKSTFSNWVPYFNATSKLLSPLLLATGNKDVERSMGVLV